MRKYILSISVLFLTVLSSFGQDSPWTLEACISYAMENNILIKQTELNTQYNENTLKQSKLSQIPNLNANANFNSSYGRDLDETTNQFTDGNNSVGLSASSSMVLFNGFQKRNTIEQNKLNLLASYEDVQKIRNDISLNIAAAYLQIMFNNELLQVALNQRDITGQQVERTQKLVDAGKVARGNSLEIQAQFASEELNVVNSENQLLLSYLNLQQILDLQYDPSFEIINPDLPVPGDSLLLMDVSSVYELAEEIMPQIKSALFNLESTQKGLDIAKGARYPSLSLGANTSTGFSDKNQKRDEFGIPIVGNYPFFEQLNDLLNVGFGFNLSIPIFNGWQVKTAIANSELSLQNSKLELQNTKNNLYSTIQQSYADALAALKKFRATEQALISMEESFKYTEKKFEVGLVNTVDYNTSKNQLTMTQSELLQAKYDFIFKTKILNFYKGEAITL